MATVANLMVEINGDSSGLQSEMTRAQSASTTLLKGVGVLGAGIAALGAKSVVNAAKLESTTVAFTTMLGSAQDATKMLKELQTFSASTPFEFTEITAASQKLLAFGVNADDITDTLRNLGDVSAGIGAPIGEIAELYGKAKTQGRLFAEDINQLTGRGIPIIAELAKQFGVSESEVKKLVESGSVGFDNLQTAFEDMTASGSQFGGLMEAQSQTLAGMWSNLVDNLGQSSVVLGQTIVDALDLKPKLQSTIDALGDVTTLLQNEGLKGAIDEIFPKSTQAIIVGMAGAITGALIPAFVGLATSVGIAVAALAPFIAAGAAVAGMIYLINGAVKENGTVLQMENKYWLDTAANMQGAAKATDTASVSMGAFATMEGKASDERVAAAAATKAETAAIIASLGGVTAAAKTASASLTEM